MFRFQTLFFHVCTLPLEYCLICISVIEICLFMKQSTVHLHVKIFRSVYLGCILRISFEQFNFRCFTMLFFSCSFRNEVWRYHPGFGTSASRTRLVWTRGLIPGLILGYCLYLANQEFLKRHPGFYHWHDPDFPEKHHDDAHGGHHDGGHHWVWSEYVVKRSIDWLIKLRFSDFFLVSFMVWFL